MIIEIFFIYSKEIIYQAEENNELKLKAVELSNHFLGNFQVLDIFMSYTQL